MPLSHLNAEQYAAAMAPLGHNLVIASAGTGKTSTIVARIAHMIEDGVKPEHILLLTFTNKAAAEMIERVAGFFGKEVAERIESGTFHAVSYRLLKSLGKNIILKQPKELKTLLKTIHGKRRFDHIDSTIKPYQSSYLYDLYSLYQNATKGEDFSSWLEASQSEHGVYFDIYEDILSEFAEQKKRFRYVDFNDLLILMRKQLIKGAPIYFKEILVDEYQDTNTLQGTLIDAFKCKSLFCVGDYDQSIYAFNGANIDIIGSFDIRYPRAQVFTLTKNYRSSYRILSLATRVIEKNERLYPKALEVTRNGEFDSPKLLIYDELFSQYQAIARLIQESTTSHKEVAVIFRNNSSADGIEACLREIGISCKRRGGLGFFDSREVKAIIDLLTVAINPRDMMSFIHLFEYAKGIGPALSKEIFDGLYELGEGDISKGLFSPKEGINPFEKRIRNRQLGLFDDQRELGSVAKFYKLGFDETFLSNPILKISRLNEEGAEFL
ncbi:MAG: ATP-dependent helicase, partial [Campylobacteraceae bacterium]|nr:ATP-dependent helicase [Campylobacteraceae bacterium]